jgi:hypothetical protein
MLILYLMISLAATSTTGTLVVPTSFEEGVMFEWLFRCHMFCIQCHVSSPLLMPVVTALLPSLQPLSLKKVMWPVIYW